MSKTCQTVWESPLVQPPPHASSCSCAYGPLVTCPWHVVASSNCHWWHSAMPNRWYHSINTHFTAWPRMIMFIIPMIRTVRWFLWFVDDPPAKAAKLPSHVSFTCNCKTACPHGSEETHLHHGMLGKTYMLTNITLYIWIDCNSSQPWIRAILG